MKRYQFSPLVDGDIGTACIIKQLNNAVGICPMCRMPIHMCRCHLKENTDAPRSQIGAPDFADIGIDNADDDDSDEDITPEHNVDATSGHPSAAQWAAMIKPLQWPCASEAGQ